MREQKQEWNNKTVNKPTWREQWCIIYSDDDNDSKVLSVYFLYRWRYVHMCALFHANMHMWLQIHIHVYSLNIVLTSKKKIGFRCADKYSNQAWSIQFRPVRLINV